MKIINVLETVGNVLLFPSNVVSHQIIGVTQLVEVFPHFATQYSILGDEDLVNMVKDVSLLGLIRATF